MIGNEPPAVGAMFTGFYRSALLIAAVLPIGCMATGGPGGPAEEGSMDAGGDDVDVTTAGADDGTDSPGEAEGSDDAPGDPPGPPDRF